MGFRDIPTLRRHYAGQAGTLVNEFYIPVLRQAVRYDRQAGYFDSASFAQLASGLAAFLKRFKDLLKSDNPPMRLITGATWTPDDISAYQKGRAALNESLNQSLLNHFEPSDEECLCLGLPPGWRPEEDQIARNRLGALAWLVAAGLLEVRIALPLDHHGRPYQPGRCGALYHPKAGVLHDEDGQIISFQGSVNETGSAWTRNREKFEVKRSWFSPQDMEDIQLEIQEFDTIWQGHDPGLLVLPLPRAVREHLKSFSTWGDPPEHDPMEIDLSDHLITEEDRIKAQWFLEAPRMPGGEHLVLEPLWADGKRFQLFPHQEKVVVRATAEYPQSFLFCDEVGLGKTIEAGLSLRTLLLRGHVQRALIITPRSLIRQWMEELREKFALTAWFYDGRTLVDVGGRIRRSDAPLEEDGLIIASRHLLARSDRQPELLHLEKPWDLVVVDEAHAARQKVFREREPNLLLRLLQELRTRQLFRSLWLLTATPMQLDPHEVHDLLLLCGLDDPSWQAWASMDGFIGFFEKLRRFQLDKRVRLETVKMTRIAVEKGASDLDPNRSPVGWQPFSWEGMIRRFRNEQGLLLALQQLPAPQAESMIPLLSRQTPLAVYMFRHTRSTLRAYQEKGLVHGLATRAPEDIPVMFQSAEEHALYHRIDELCSRFYRLADLPEDERSGVGFLMAVFRKRLASSFVAFQKSLERRRQLIETLELNLMDLEAQLKGDLSYYDSEDDDEEDLDLRQAIDAEQRRLLRLHADPDRREKLRSELLYLQDYIRALQQLPADSKFETFRERLAALVNVGTRIIVFTQFLDTLDFIRERLVPHFGDRIACYSGRGGEVWDAALNRWRWVEKSEIKSRCRQDHPQAIRILLGTEAASEGLNLQQFSVLVNYDLPWNPMRVEQRIGRIDRIGQDAPVVRILNLYVQGTIEEDAYHTLKVRIGAFEEVVGPLQPILAEMPRIFRRVARGELELAEARRLLDEAAQRVSGSPLSALEDCTRQEDLGPSQFPHPEPNATQAQLAGWCLAHPAPGMRIITVAEPGTNTVMQDGTQACLSITWALTPEHLGISPNEEILATFSGELADRQPPTGPSQDEYGTVTRGTEGVRLLTWGDPYQEAWLGAIRGEPHTEPG
jgi:hypothetical protein